MSLIMSVFNRIFGRGQKAEGEEVRTVVVLSSEQYKAFERRLPGPGLNHASSSEQYAFNLGVQFALSELRKGFVHGDNP